MYLTFSYVFITWKKSFLFQIRFRPAIWFTTRKKISTKKYNTIGTVPEFNGKVVKTAAKLTPLTHIYMTPHCPELIKPHKKLSILLRKLLHAMPLCAFVLHLSFINDQGMGYVPFVTFPTLSVLFSFMTYHRVCRKSNTTGITSGAGTTNPSGAHECTRGF